MGLSSHKQHIMSLIDTKIEYLCKSQVWPISSAKAYAWLHNFRQSEDHRYLAYLLLDKFSFRTNEMIKSGFKKLFATKIRKEFNKLNGTNYTVNEFLAHLNSPSKFNPLTNRFCISYVVGSSGERAESGASILRLLNSDVVNQNFNLSDNDSLSRLADKNVILVIVDDFSGSGEQALGFFTSGFAHTPGSDIYTMHHVKKIFCPYISQSCGFTALAVLPEIDLSPVEVVFPHDSIFYNSGHGFSRDPTYSPVDAKELYENMKSTYNIRLLDNWCGRDNAELGLIFESGVPNQSLGAITYHADNWRALQTRRAN
jgi:hypothetical protein